MQPLLELSLHGSAVFLLVWLLDRVLAFRMKAMTRRLLWLLVPASFLLSFPLAVLPAQPKAPLPLNLIASASFGFGNVPGPSFFVTHGSFWMGIWLSGAATYLLFVFIETRIALVRWHRERLSTEPVLLNLLEDCKQEAGVTAPIGLVVSEAAPAPAIMGWLRPRLLLPKDLATLLSTDQLRSVFLHELAHFRSFDIPLNWLFTLVRALHWFNPCAHLAFFAWRNFQEEAADESALRWTQDPSSYGEALLQTLRGVQRPHPPFGALAIGESLHHLKKRLIMINQTSKKSPYYLTTGLILFVVLAGFIIRPVKAQDGDPKAAAVAAMQTWLHEIDQDQYPQSWTDASPSFQKAISSAQWVAALDSVRTPLGPCKDRKLASALHQTSVPSPSGAQNGDFVIAQFNTSFANLAYAAETVTFEKASDGTWKASGYYIKPKM